MEEGMSLSWLNSKDIRRLCRNIQPGAKGRSDLTPENRLFLERYMAGVERLHLPDHLLELLPDVLIKSRNACGKWPRLSNLRKRLESEHDEIEANMLDDALEDAYAGHWY